MNPCLLRIAVALGLCCTIASAFTYSQCDSGVYFKVRSLNLSPETAMPGQELRITISDGGRVQVRFPGISATKPLCDTTVGRRCPIGPGEVSIPFVQPIPRAANLLAGRSVSGRTVVYDNNRNMILCMEIKDVPIAARSREDTNGNGGGGGGGGGGRLHRLDSIIRSISAVEPPTSLVSSTTEDIAITSLWDDMVDFWGSEQTMVNTTTTTTFPK